MAWILDVQIDLDKVIEEEKWKFSIAELIRYEVQVQLKKELREMLKVDKRVETIARNLSDQVIEKFLNLVVVDASSDEATKANQSNESA